MRTVESTFPGADGVTLHTVVWSPDEDHAEPVADVMLIHGLGEHSGAERTQDGIRGIVLTSPALVPAESIPKILVKLANVVGKIAPSLPTIALEGDAISRVQRVRDDYDHDPLNYRGKLTAGTGRQMNLAMAMALRDAAKITIPLLILHGDADRLASIEGSRRLAKAVSSTDCTMQEWPGAYHELHHEPERLEVLHTITRWIQQRL